MKRAKTMVHVDYDTRDRLTAFRISEGFTHSEAIEYLLNVHEAVQKDRGIKIEEVPGHIKLVAVQ